MSCHAPLRPAPLGIISSPLCVRFDDSSVPAANPLAGAIRAYRLCLRLRVQPSHGSTGLPGMFGEVVPHGRVTICV